MFYKTKIIGNKSQIQRAKASIFPVLMASLVFLSILTESDASAGVRHGRSSSSSGHSGTKWSKFGFNIDADLGFSATSGSTNNIGGFTYAARLGYSSNIMWEIGLSYSSFGSSTSVSSAGVTTVTENSLALVLSDFNYHLMRELHPIYIGMVIGFGITTGNSSVAGGTPKSVPGVFNLGFGVRGGYDHEIGKGFTVGPEGRIVFLMASTSLTVFQGLMSVKFWF